MNVYMVICDRYKHGGLLASRASLITDWTVCLSKQAAVDFIAEFFEAEVFYDADVVPALRKILETDEPQSLSKGLRCLEAPSWLIGGEHGRYTWSAAVSIETLDGVERVEAR